MLFAGAIGSITSAVTVAASSFGMAITDPGPMLKEIDVARLEDILGGSELQLRETVDYVEPGSQEPEAISSLNGKSAPEETSQAAPTESAKPTTKIVGKVQTLGDFIDTDALAPAEALIGNLSAEELGKYCLYHTHPDFRRRVKEDGLNIVVAGKAFGVGSSRENAVSALLGAGVQCVIARSFAFIYARNQPNLGLLGIVIEDNAFYELAKDGADIEIDVYGRTIRVGNQTFGFSMAQLEIQLWEQGGMSAAFAKWGKGLLRAMTGSKPTTAAVSMEENSADGKPLEW